MRSATAEALSSDRLTGTIWVMRLFETSGLSASSSPIVEIALRDELSVRDPRWSQAVAVGSSAFVEKVKSELGINALPP